MASSNDESSQLPFNSRRSCVYGTHGMVATSQPLASEIGLRVLQDGGNAVDASIAIAAALSVTEPCSTGIGGDCFLLYYDAKTKQVSALNGSGRAPASLSIEKVLKDCDNVTSGTIPITHPHAVTVPGAVAGWADAMTKWGSKDLFDVLKPAIDLATDGFAVSEITAYHWKAGEWQLKSGGELNNGHELLMADTLAAPVAGQVWRNQPLADSLSEIARHGKDAFYKTGRIAEAIVNVAGVENGGTITLEDLASHVTTFPEPIHTSFKSNIDVYEVPPNGQGITALVALNILNHLPLDNVCHNSSEYLHVVIEAMRLAFADTRYYVSDPDFTDIPVKGLLSSAYGKERAALINPHKCIVDPVKGSPALSSDTVSFQVVDTDGNAVSMVNSNYTGFGTGLVPKGCGFSLQSRGSNFSLQSSHPNALAPGKRPYHTIIPAMSVHSKTSELHSTFSVMGGFMQPQGHVQVLCNMLLFGMNPQKALDVPRFCIGSGHMGCVGEVSVEPGLSTEVMEELKTKGHDVKVVRGHGRSLFGRGQIIVRDPETNVLAGGSDGRSDGCVMGW